jgi:hypothetical protein
MSSETARKIASCVPGYVGYWKREDRKTSDSLIRNYVASAVSSALAKLSELAKGQAEALLEKLELAAQDYSRFFELGKIDEEVLEQVYIRDLALVETAKRLEETEDVNQLAELLQALERALDSRNNVLRDISKAPPAVLKPGKKRKSILWRVLRG